MPRKPIDETTPGRCRICGCTEFAACAPRCFCVEPTLCSTCAKLRDQIANYATMARRTTKGGVMRLFDEAVNVSRLNPKQEGGELNL